MGVLDDVPMASVSFVAGVVLATIGYLNGDLSVFQALAAAGIVAGGGGALGHARNGAGRGMRRK